MSKAEENPTNSKSIHPKKVLLALLALNLFLGIILLLFPSGKINITDDLSLQFLSKHDLLYQDSSVKVDLDSVIADIQTIDTTITELDSNLISEVFELEENRQIQYPDNTKNAMANFFKALYNTYKTGELIRIVHYGDSQLEGDRISDYIRNKMQLRFGGMGPGIVLPIDISRSRISVRQSESKDWQKYAVFGKTKRHDKGLYGIGCSSYAYSGEFQVKIGEDTTIKKVFYAPGAKDSLKMDSTKLEASGMTPQMAEDSFYYDTIIKGIYKTEIADYSWLKYRCAKRSFPLVRKYEQVRLLYASDDAFQLATAIDGKERSLFIPRAPLMGVHTIHSDTVTQSVKLGFVGPSPLIYGVALDGKTGVAVDNFPMRGSSGTGYGMINNSLMKKQFILTNTKLLVMQFGINVIPNPQKSYGYYERMFSSQLKVLKAANPDLSILVIGPSDMSRKRGGKYVSYPNVHLIRDAMKNAAFANGCAFWDLYEAMGGENSMVSWVQNDPPLAGRDFTHFNSRGAAYVGEMIYSALIDEYQKFIQIETPTTKVQADSTAN